MNNKVFAVDRRIGRKLLIDRAHLLFHGDGGRSPRAGDGFLQTAVREIESLRSEVARLDFGELNVYDVNGSRLSRARRRRRQVRRDPTRQEAEAACAHSYVLRGLEGLLRRRGVGLEFLEYVYASATAEPEPRWLPLGKGAYEIEPILGGEHDERLTLYPRCLRFGDWSSYDEIASQAIELYHATDEAGGWSRRRSGPKDLPWWDDDLKSAWWSAMLYVLRGEGRPAHKSTGETNVTKLYALVRLRAKHRKLDMVDARTFGRWFKKHWLMLIFNAPSPDVPPHRLVGGNLRDAHPKWQHERVPAHWVRGRGWVLD